MTLMSLLGRVVWRWPATTTWLLVMTALILLSLGR